MNCTLPGNMGCMWRKCGDEYAISISAFDESLVLLAIRSRHSSEFIVMWNVEFVELKKRSTTRRVLMKISWPKPFNFQVPSFFCIAWRSLVDTRHNRTILLSLCTCCGLRLHCVTGVPEDPGTACYRYNSALFHICRCLTNVQRRCLLMHWQVLFAFLHHYERPIENVSWMIINSMAFCHLHQIAHENRKLLLLKYETLCEEESDKVALSIHTHTSPIQAIVYGSLIVFMLSMLNVSTCPLKTPWVKSQLSLSVCDVTPWETGGRQCGRSTGCLDDISIHRWEGETTSPQNKMVWMIWCVFMQIPMTLFPLIVVLYLRRLDLSRQSFHRRGRVRAISQDWDSICSDVMIICGSRLPDVLYRWIVAYSRTVCYWFRSGSTDGPSN